MTDEELILLYHEEIRLYRAYRKSEEEDSRRPQLVAAKRDAWERLYRKLREVLPAEKLREILQVQNTRRKR